MKRWNTDIHTQRRKMGRDRERWRKRMQETVWNTDSTKKLGVLHPVNQYSYFRAKYKEKGRVKEEERDGEKKGDRGWYADRQKGRD